MSELLSEITYPHKANTLEVEYSKMISQGEKNFLIFRFINNSSKVVIAYHTDIAFCDASGHKQIISVSEKNAELLPATATKEYTVELPCIVKNGEITVLLALYDDLSADTAQSDVPFATFEKASEVVNEYLAGNAVPEQIDNTEEVSAHEICATPKIDDDKSNWESMTPINFSLVSILLCGLLVILAVLEFM